MFRSNRELRCSLTALVIATAVFAVAGFCVSALTGALILGACLIAAAVFLLTERYRYRRLQKLSTELDALLINGTPLPITEYNEGELSILANQIQKITLLLKDSAETVKADKKYLADALADISHQLRTPLTAMNLTASMLRDPELTTQKRAVLLDELRILLARTEWLVETLLKLSKLDAGMVKLQCKPVQVNELIRRASAPLAIPMELRGQRLAVSCQAEIFEGDLVWTAEALGNILKNCMEHTPEGGSVTVTAAETALYTQIEVQDTGRGFAPEDIPHLFERFYKGSNAGENSYGIGLALARTVISGQNGTLQAMNTEQGARFVIKFYKQVI